MPYIGRDLNRGNYLKLDDISSSFNSSTKTFNLTVGGSAFIPGSAFAILVSVGGVIQEPESAYQINNSEITFANAPTAQDGFFCLALAVPIGIGVPGNGTVNGTQVAKPFNYDGYFYLDDANNRVGIGSLQPKQELDVIGNANISGILTASSFSGGSGGINAGVVTCTGLDVNGNGDISGNLVLGGDLTVNGTTTTLDTNLIGVDRIEVGANSSTVVGVAITQSGTADILRLYDGTSQIVTVDDTGNVGLGSAIPAQKLDVVGTSNFQGEVQLLSGNQIKLLNDANTANVTVDCDGGARFHVKSYSQSVIQAQENWGIKFFQGTGTERFTIEPTGGVVVGAGGTIYMPEYIKHSGDTDTYFGFPTSNQFDIWTNSNRRLNVNSDGGFTFNHTTVGTSYNFQGPSNDNNWGGFIKLNSNNNSTVVSNIHASTSGMWFTHGGDYEYRLMLKSDGKVGIGTNNPDNKLKITVTSGNDGVVVQNTSTANIALYGARNGDATIQMGQFGSTASGTTFGIANTNLAFIYTTSYASTHPSALLIGNSAGIPLIFATSGTERLRIKSDGEILLGTGGVDRPIAGQRFNSASGWGGTLQIEKPNPSNGNNNIPMVAITAFNGANEQYTGGISFNRSNSNTQGTQGAVNTNQQLGNIAFNGSDGTNFIQGAEIFAIPDQTFATNDGPASLVFATTPDGTSETRPQERVRITSGGRLLIGTSTSNISGSFSSVVATGAAGNNGGFQVHYNAGAYGGGSMTTVNAAGGGLDFWTYTGNVGSEANYNRRLRIDSSGRVHIGNAGLSATSASDDLTVGNLTGDHGITIHSATDSAGFICFGDTDTTGIDSRRGVIRYQQSDDSMRFAVNGNNEAMRIASDYKVMVGMTTTGTSTSNNNFELASTKMLKVGSMYIGYVIGTGNNGSGVLILHKMGQNVGLQFSGMVTVHSYTGSAYLSGCIVVRYNTDAVTRDVTLQKADSGMDFQIVSGTISGESGTYFGIKKNGGGTGSFYVNAFINGNIESYGGIREVPNGNWTTNTVHGSGIT